VNEKLLDAALAFADAGCSVVPAAADGSKAPAGKWQRWQAERPDTAQLTHWLSNGAYDGFGVVCGAVSGGLEMLELEGRAVASGVHIAYRDALVGHGLDGLWQRIVTGYAETTSSGGIHILYRVDGKPRGNTRLAVTAAGEPLIETRGEGGFTITAPSGGRTHPTGKPWQLSRGDAASIAVITGEERDALHAVASLLTQAAPRQVQIPAAAGSPADGRPGDDYNARASWQDILGPHGWECVRAFGPGTYGWRRPGKETPGISATTRETGGLFVFSTSTPFDTETPYSKFAAYTLLNHGGDYAAAAAQLRRDGYGAPRQHDDDGIGDLIAAPAATGQPAALAGPHVVSLADVQAEHVDWLWDGYLPLGKVVVLDGDPGVGKSTLSLDIAARTSTGSPMPDGSAGVKGTVLILSAEDGLADTIRPRLDAAAADPARIMTITEMTYDTADGPLSRPVTIPGDLAAIERIIAEHDVRLVVIDVLMAYLSGDVNAHRDQDIRRALHVLSSLAERTRCCVIVLRHLNKSGGGNAIYRGGGSIGIIGAARAGFMCGRDPDDETGQLRVFASIKMNIAAEPPALGYRLVPDELHGCGRIEWLGQSEYRAGDLLSDHDDDRTERDEAAGWLTGYLTDAGGEAARKDIFRDGRAAGFKDATLKRAKDKARVTHRSEGFPRQTVWVLPVGSADTRQDNAEPTEPTGADLGKQAPESLHSAQSAQYLELEPTEPTGLCAECGEPLDQVLIDAGFTDHGETE
jgi:hypothetical protein